MLQALQLVQLLVLQQVRDGAQRGVRRSGENGRFRQVGLCCAMVLALGCTFEVHNPGSKRHKLDVVARSLCCAVLVACWPLHLPWAVGLHMSLMHAAADPRAPTDSSSHAWTLRCFAFCHAMFLA